MTIMQSATLLTTLHTQAFLAVNPWSSSHGRLLELVAFHFLPDTRNLVFIMRGGEIATAGLDEENPAVSKNLICITLTLIHLHRQMLLETSTPEFLVHHGAQTKQVRTLGTVRTHDESTSERILIPQPSNDPNDPLNW